MSKWPDPTPGICDNCGASLYGDYCHLCGQHEKSYIRNVFSLVSEFLQEFGNWDSRLMRTLVPLLFRPGFLSNEYVAGRRVRYVPPVRLYLFISLIFFLVLTFVARVDTTDWVQQTIEQQRAAAIAAAEAGVEIPPVPECRPGTGIRIHGDERRPMDERVCVSIPGFADETNEKLRRQIVRVSGMPDLAFQQARQLAPLMMFLLLPVFAFLLKILYLFSKRYYTEHLTLALHTHSFIFLAFLLLLMFGGITDWAEAGDRAWIGKPVGFASAALLVWMPVYLWIAQWRFYRQGWFVTTFKYFTTAFVYMMMVSMTALVLTLVSVAIA